MHRLAVMRYLVGFVVVVALVPWPLSVSAQDVEEGTASEQNPEESAPPSEPAPEEPMLQLKLDDAGVEVVPSPPQTFGGYTLEEMELRVKRAQIGLYVSALSFLAGAFSMAFAGVCGIGEWTERCDRLWSAGITLMVGGGIGMIVSAALLGNRKHQLRELRQAHYETRRRVQWDIARSALVF